MKMIYILSLRRNLPHGCTGKLLLWLNRTSATLQRVCRYILWSLQNRFCRSSDFIAAEFCVRRIRCDSSQLIVLAKFPLDRFDHMIETQLPGFACEWARDFSGMAIFHTQRRGFITWAAGWGLSTAQETQMRSTFSVLGTCFQKFIMDTL